MGQGFKQFLATPFQQTVQFVLSLLLPGKVLLCLLQFACCSGCIKCRSITAQYQGFPEPFIFLDASFQFAGF